MAKEREIVKEGPKFENLVQTCLKQALPQRDDILQPLIETHAQSLQVLNNPDSQVHSLAPEDFAHYFEDVIRVYLQSNTRHVYVAKNISQMASVDTIEDVGRIRHVLLQKLSGNNDGDDGIAVNNLKAIFPNTTDGKIVRIRRSTQIVLARDSKLLKEAVMPILRGLDEQALMAERAFAQVLASGHVIIEESKNLPAIFRTSKNSAHQAQDDAKAAAAQVDRALAEGEGVLNDHATLLARDDTATSLLEILTRESAKEFTATVRTAESTARTMLVAAATVSNAEILRITQRQVEDLAAISLGNTLVFQRLLIAYAFMEAMTARAVTQAQLRDQWNGVVATLANEYSEISDALQKRLPANVLMTGRE